MSEPNIREIAAKFNGTVWDGTHVGALAADWLRLDAPLEDFRMWLAAEIGRRGGVGAISDDPPTTCLVIARSVIETLTAPLGNEKFAQIEARPLMCKRCRGSRMVARHIGTSFDTDSRAEYYDGYRAEKCPECGDDIPALLQEIRRLTTTSRCRCFYGGYQPVPIQCGLDVHTGQHAGIGDNGATVIWPEIAINVTCPDCNGAGALSYSAFWLRTCEACGGTGRVRR